MRDTAYKVLQVKERLTAERQKEPDISEIAGILSIPRQEVFFALDAITEPISIYEPVFSDGGESICVMERNGIYIIDLQKTVKKLEEAYDFVRDLSAKGENILFVGTKKQAQDAVREEAVRVGQYFVNARWLGGMLTNFKTMWRPVLHPSWAEACGCLIIMNDIDGRYVFDSPVAGPDGDEEGALSAIENYCIDNGVPLFITVVPESKAHGCRH